MKAVPMPSPQQLMQYAGSALAIIALILGLIFGTGDLSSQAGGEGTVATNPAPSMGGF
ncbi:putative secreted protein [Corynebacterium diphtheriae BH8]|nr:putative secreted protein [Corynebacterium diphtheriae BH8]AEX80633.1 putative secreted protein [Corynebacterium diphtheriae HC04]